MKDNTFKKNFIWNMVGTTLNSFNSMFFMIIITRLNGTEDAGVFTLLFSIVCLLYNIGIYAGRTFQVTDKTGKYNETEYVIHRIMTVSLMFIVGAIYCTVKHFEQYKFALTMLLTFMKCLEAATDCLYGIMQKNDQLYKSGISLTIKAVGSLLAVFQSNFSVTFDKLECREWSTFLYRSGRKPLSSVQRPMVRFLYGQDFY